MYYKEKVIDGILHFKLSKHDSYIKYTPEELNKLYLSLKPWSEFYLGHTLIEVQPDANGEYDPITLTEEYIYYKKKIHRKQVAILNKQRTMFPNICI